MKIFISMFSGVFSGLILISFLEMAIYSFFPLPNGLDKSNIKEYEIYLTKINNPSLLLILLSLSLGNILSGFVGTKVANEDNKIYFLINSFLILSMNIIQLTLISHPMYYNILNLLIPIPSGFIGYKISLKWLPKNT
jgi:hypothetical protein